ncbi:TIGR00366 family protein [bacterium]|nr:TIGR00366 family protein [bacterium]
MIASLSRFFTNVVHRFLPDPLIFAILLSGAVFVAGLVFTSTTAGDLLLMWGDGFWNLLKFSMQMALVLVTGHALATASAMRSAMRKVASVANTPAQGVMLVTLVAAVASVINWGFGLVLGAMFAREVARRVPKSDYSLLIASAYIGFLTWHGGLSGSIPLMAASKDNIMEKTCGLIPISQTLGTGYNLFITLALIVSLPFLTRQMLKPADQVVEVDPQLLVEEPGTQRILGPGASLAERLEESRLLNLLVVLSAFAYMGLRFWQRGFVVDVDIVNLTFLAVGMLLHGTPMAYARAIGAAARGTASIMIQYPFYAGIQMMMDKSGLGGVITHAFIQVANKHTFHYLVFFSSALVNFAIPSGGGHWAVQGPFVIPAAQALGADLGKSAMAIAYGEAWMNMAQPFWALPALAIAGLGVRDIMGYCVTALLFSSVIFLVGLALF